METAIVILLCFFYALLNVTGAALIKSQILNQSLNSFRDYLHLLTNIKVIIGFSVIFISALVIFKALSLGKFSYVIPIATGINFALTVMIGRFVFGDILTISSYAGLTVIFFGIFLMGFNK